MLHDPWLWAFVVSFVAGYISMCVLVSEQLTSDLKAQHYLLTLFWIPLMLVSFAAGCVIFYRAALLRQRHTFTIYVNGRKMSGIKSAMLSYEQVCALAGESLEATVTWAGPRVKGNDYRAHGMLNRGRSVILVDGMEFTAVVTGNA